MGPKEHSPWLAVLLAVAACGGAPERTVAPAFRTAPQTAGAELCVDCHEDVVASYARTGMARALGPVEPGELDGLGELASGPWRYGFQASDDGRHYLLGETHADVDSHALGAPAVLGIGAGELDRSIAVVHGAGMRFAPVEVVSTTAGRHLALAPGEAMDPGGRLDFAITPECLGCHTDALPPAGYPLDRLPDPAAWTPRGISCAGCHGTAEQLADHVAWQEADLSGEQPPSAVDPVLDLGAMGRAERLSVCARCHLQGDARLVLENGELGPPPVGVDLLHHRALFVGTATPEAPTTEVGFVSQVERLALSACFLESELDCSSCHDPHRDLREPEPRARVRGACLDCHADPDACARPDPGRASDEALVRTMANGERALERLGGARPDCATCHMPLTGVFDVAEVLIHDHHVRRDGSNARGPALPSELRFPEAPDGDWTRFAWPFTEAPDHQDEHGLWLLAYAAGGHPERAVELVDREPGPTAAGLAMYHHVRAGLLEATDRAREAEEAYRRALELDPDLAPATSNLALVLHRRGEHAPARELLDALLLRHPAYAPALRNRALVRDAVGDTGGALGDLETALSLDPDAELARTLARAAEAAGLPDKATRFAAMARDLDPAPR